MVLDQKMNTLKYIAEKYKLNLKDHPPIQIPNVGRNNLADLFCELGFKTGVEIGTERGLYAEVLCKANPKAKLFCIDPWKIYPEYRDIVKQNKMDEIYNEAKSRLSAFNCKLIKKFSLDALKDFADESLDFTYIDGNHEYPYITRDIIEWSKKVRPGGIVVGHDYTTSNQLVSRNQVFWAVNGYMNAYNIRSWFILGTKAEVPGEIRDKPRSWMWIKE
jgi:predicted O-methyltransferase YrrM